VTIEKGPVSFLYFNEFVFKQLIDNFSVAFGHHPAIAKNPNIVQFG